MFIATSRIHSTCLLPHQEYTQHVYCHTKNDIMFKKYVPPLIIVTIDTQGSRKKQTEKEANSQSTK